MNLRFEEEMKKEKRKNILRELVYFLIAAVIVIFIAWLVVHFALKKASVLGGSMETTLYNGEDVIINKSSYLIFSPGRNAVIAFYPEEDKEKESTQDDSSIMIRRVVGLPGEKVQIKDGKVYIDGEVLEEKYAFPDMQSGGAASSEVTLGDDEYFVLSDNRSDMDDSRNSSFTKVKKSNIIGKVIFRLSPFALVGGPEEKKKTE